VTGIPGSAVFSVPAVLNIFPHQRKGFQHGGHGEHGEKIAEISNLFEISNHESKS
jgi:hypothetical protein